jgi:hypothetical protein
MIANFCGFRQFSSKKFWYLLATLSHIVVISLMEEQLALHRLSHANRVLEGQCSAIEDERDQLEKTSKELIQHLERQLREHHAKIENLESQVLHTHATNQ